MLRAKLISSALGPLCIPGALCVLAMIVGTPGLDSHAPISMQAPISAQAPISTPVVGSPIVASRTVDPQTVGTPGPPPDAPGRRLQIEQTRPCGSTACDCEQTGAPTFEGPLPAVFYRVDTRPPTDGSGTGIFDTGFVARGRGLDLVDHVLRSRGALQSGYVAAADSPEGAAMFAAGYFAFNPDVTSLWVYTVRATDTFHNVEQSLRHILASTPPASADHTRIEDALVVSRLQREWVSADPVAPALIQRGHEISRSPTEFNPNSPHTYVNDGYQSGDTHASCRLI